MAKYLKIPISHEPLELDEIQSLNLHKITEHKVRQAYEKIGSPVLVEDVSLTIKVLGKLPGPLIKWFLEELGNDGLCKLADLDSDRSATAEITYAYFDGKLLKFFDGQEKGSIAQKPRGSGGFGWNPVFIPEGSSKTYAEMDEIETEQFSLRTPVFVEIRKFLVDLDKA